MKPRALALLLLGLALGVLFGAYLCWLAPVIPADAQSVGFWGTAATGTRTNCTQITSPVSGQIVCLDQAANALKVWDGLRWVVASATQAGILNVKDFGAVGDGRSNTNAGQDGSMSLGSASLRSVNIANGFTAADVGKLIVVYGAGAGGVDLYSTVASFISAASVTLSNTAATAVSGAQVLLATDDTAAIQAAYDRANDFTQQAQPAGGAKNGTIPMVVFPSGIYGCCRTVGILPTDAYSRTLGLGQPMLVGMSATVNILDFVGGYLNSVEGMAFVGGAKQVRYGNTNLDTALFTISKTDFIHNNGQPAVEFYAQSPATTLSVVSVIRESRFNDVYQAVVTIPGVRLTVKDTWVEVTNTGVRPPSMVDGPLFVNYGQMVFDGMYGVPSPQGPTTNARWIDNHGAFAAVNSRFGNEGNGMPIVYNFVGPATSYPYMQSTSSYVSIRDSQISMGPINFPMRCVICYITDIPQTQILENNFYGIQDSNQFLNAATLSVTNYINALNANDYLYVRIKGNQGWIPFEQGGIPASLTSTNYSKVYFELDNVAWPPGRLHFSSSTRSNAASEFLTFSTTTNALLLGTAAPVGAAPLAFTGLADTRYGLVNLNSTTNNYVTFTEQGVSNRGAIGFTAGNASMRFIANNGGIDNGTLVMSLFQGLSVGTTPPADKGAGAINVASSVWLNSTQTLWNGSSAAGTPQCTNNCGSAPALVGTNTAMRVTMGATGTPATPFLVLFNGTWNATPSCLAQIDTPGTTAATVTRANASTTGVLINTVVNPPNGAVYSVHCLGVG